LGIGDFWKEVKRRKVLRVAVVYLAVAWMLIQIAETTFEPLQLPPWALTLLVVLAIAGFPISLVLGWAFDITRQGVVRDTGDAQPEAGDGPAAASVAVLPFTDMSESQDQGYFCDGIAEEILNTLTQVKGLKVASRTSSFQFRQQALGVREIGHQLEVRHVLEGSVRKASDHLRITAQLINVADGYHLWSERFDTSIHDVFKVQENIARNIARALSVTLAPESLQIMEASSTRDIQAYDYYLKAWSYFHKFDLQNMLYARKMFSRAIDIDPCFARAWAGLADAAAFLYMYGERKEEYCQQADEASSRALALCPKLAETRASRGLALLLQSRYAESASEFEQAIELNPDSFEAHYFFARACIHQGKYEMAARLFQRAAQLDPDDCQSAALLPQVFAALGDKEQEMRWLKEGMRRGQRRLELNPDDVRTLYLTGVMAAKAGDRERALELADRTRTLAPDSATVNYNLACLYAQIGETDKALETLEACTAATGIINRDWVQHDSDLIALREHPRFKAILESLS